MARPPVPAPVRVLLSGIDPSQPLSSSDTTDRQRHGIGVARRRVMP